MRIFYRFSNNLNTADCLTSKFTYDSSLSTLARPYTNALINGKSKSCEYINRSLINNILTIAGIIALIEEMCRKEQLINFSGVKLVDLNYATAV